MTPETSVHEALPTHVVRFSNWARVQHAAILILFVLLLLTGLPQKWPVAPLSGEVVDALGGIFATRWMHRVAGGAFSALLIVHLGLVIGGVLTGRIRPTMLLRRRDFEDVVASVRYDLGRGEEVPRFGRYDYRQKFEYWGLIFGSFIMVFTGLVLLFPMGISRLLPAEIIPASKVAHSNEALLALGIILVWHLYGAHLNPDVFPFDTSIFTGKISRERLLHEHGLEYEEMFGPEMSEPSVPVEAADPSETTTEEDGGERPDPDDS